MDPTTQALLSTIATLIPQIRASMSATTLGPADMAVFPMIRASLNAAIQNLEAIQRTIQATAALTAGVVTANAIAAGVVTANAIAAASTTTTTNESVP